MGIRRVTDLPTCRYFPHTLGILELPLTIGIGPDRKAPFVQQPMMTAAEQKCITQAGLPAIRPVHHMMRIQPAFMTAPGYVSRHITGFMWRAGLCGVPSLPLGFN